MGAMQCKSKRKIENENEKSNTPIYYLSAIANKKIFDKVRILSKEHGYRCNVYFHKHGIEFEGAGKMVAVTPFEKKMQENCYCCQHRFAYEFCISSDLFEHYDFGAPDGLSLSAFFEFSQISEFLSFEKTHVQFHISSKESDTHYYYLYKNDLNIGSNSNINEHSVGNSKSFKFVIQKDQSNEKSIHRQLKYWSSIDSESFVNGLKLVSNVPTIPTETDVEIIYLKFGYHHLHIYKEYQELVSIPYLYPINIESTNNDTIIGKEIDLKLRFNREMFKVLYDKDDMVHIPKIDIYYSRDMISFKREIESHQRNIPKQMESLSNNFPKSLSLIILHYLYNTSCQIGEFFPNESDNCHLDCEKYTLQTLFNFSFK